jgi:predicted anti-sigma-YlaC factor YlaD
MRKDPHELTCREVNAFLDAYLRRTIGDRERSVFDAHLAACPDCRNYLQQYDLAQRLARQTLTNVNATVVPEDLVQAILKTRDASDPPPPSRRRK